MQTKAPRCAACPFAWPERACRAPGGKGPTDCPTLHSRDLARLALDRLSADPQALRLARQSSIQEGAGYADRHKGYACVKPIKPRIVETVEFARRIGASRLGLAFCIGLRAEAAVVAEIFQTNGLTVVSTACKVGSIPKSAIGLEPEHQVVPASPAETMCNPVLQALLANQHQTELNVLLGLCVGHDSLFIKYADAPCTVLAVKDRVFGHAPLTPVHQYDSYCRYLKAPLEE